MEYKNIFVTVGTTEFSQLIKTINCEEFIRVFKWLGCQKLTIQYGNGCQFDPVDMELAGIEVITYKMKPNISTDIENADLIISHAGAGTCLEVLRLGKPLVVVVNEKLMDNHQIELAEQMEKDGHLYYCACWNLRKKLLDSDFSNLKPYVKGDTNNFIRNLDMLMGFSNKNHKE